MFNSGKIRELELQLQASQKENARLKEFYEETQKQELVRLQGVIREYESETTALKTKNNEMFLQLTNAKETVRRELDQEYKQKLEEANSLFNQRLDAEAENNAKKLELIEAQMAAIIENRVKEATAIQMAEYEKNKVMLEHTKELCGIYKNKFESGKIELGADEIKGMLLSANPNGQKILETMKSF